MPRKCVEPDCEKWSQGKTDKCIAHGGGPRCVEPDCRKSARSKSDKCKAHGGGPRCVVSGCAKSAQSKSDKCVGHGGGNRCVENGCKKSSISKSNKCFAHGGGKRCIEHGCEKSAQGKSDRCISHGGGPRCVQSGCLKSSTDKSGKCISHGGGPRCIVDGCMKGAQKNTEMCIAHGGGPRCIVAGCQKSAIGTTYKCIAHGGGVRCPNCITWIDSRCGKKHYDGYCATCFKQLFPNDERSKVLYLHTKEIRVRNAINENFEGFIHDKPLYTGHCDCTMRRRIDHRKLIDATLLCIETDEFAHKGYDPKDEEVRYDDLYMVHSGKWIFIRFNPDGKGVDMVDKLNRLIEEIHFQIMRINHSENTELLEVIKLFY
jgi:hypothetical protein